MHIRHVQQVQKDLLRVNNLNVVNHCELFIYLDIANLGSYHDIKIFHHYKLHKI
jgi:hypothetical protein